MPVAPGALRGPYEILSCMGMGGMGEVWKARDTPLDREVAIKISKEQFGERFEREARAVGTSTAWLRRIAPLEGAEGVYTGRSIHIDVTQPNTLS